MSFNSTTEALSRSRNARVLANPRLHLLVVLFLCFSFSSNPNAFFLPPCNGLLVPSFPSRLGFSSSSSSSNNSNNNRWRNTWSRSSSTKLFYASKNETDSTTTTITTPTGAISSFASLSPGTISKNQERLSQRKFPRTWVPLASVFELDPSRPTPLEFLDQKYVCYKQTLGNEEDDWIVMDDVCPHRLVPLSEGRISRVECTNVGDDGADTADTDTGTATTTTTTIQCSYHGWEFDGSQKGACVKIPQAKQELEASSKTSPRAAVPTYSTRVHKNILWFWPWADTDPLSLLEVYPKGHPEGIMASIAMIPNDDNNNEDLNENEVLVSDPNTYTRDLPYGWDTLLENLIDPAHIPFAHHNLQGTREDAIPIQMTVPESLGEFVASTTTDTKGRSGEAGFLFEWQDRTMGKHRAGTAEFQAPFGIAYDGKYYDTKEEADGLWGTHSEKKKLQLNGGETSTPVDTTDEDEKERRPFSLGVLCIPTKPGWSRAIILTGGKTKKVPAKADEQLSEKLEGAATSKAVAPKESTEAKKKKKQKKSLFSLIFSIVPVWVIHLLSNRFLDSDLAFLHHQEQERLRYDGTSNSGPVGSTSYYYMPAPADRCIAKLRKWIPKHTDYMGDSGHTYSLPPPIADRSKLFDRYLQHTSHCKHCQEGLKFLRIKAKKFAWGGLLTSVVASHFLGKRLLGLAAKLLAVACLGALRLLSSLEQALLVGEFKHYEND